MDCEKKLQEPFACFLWIKRVLDGSSNKHLNDVMTLFLKHLLDHDVQNLSQESLAFMKKKLTSFLQFCVMKRPETEFQPKSKIAYEDLMAAILSFYVDVVLCLSRNMSEKQKKKESNNICTKVFYCLAPKQEYSFDVLLQLSAINETSFDLLESLCRKCLTERFLMTPASYTKFLQVLKKLSQLWPKQLQNELTFGLTVMPPMNYLTWLEKTNVGVFRSLKVSKEDDLKKIRTCLVSSLSSSLLDSVLDNISLSLENLECECSSLVEPNESTCQVKGWGHIVINDDSQDEDDDNDVEDEDDDDSSEDKNDEDIGEDEYDSSDVELSSKEEDDDSTPKKPETMEVDLTVDSDVELSGNETETTGSESNKTRIFVTQCQADAVSRKNAEISATSSNVSESAVNRHESAEISSGKVSFTPSKGRGSKRKLSDEDIGSAEKAGNTPSKPAKKQKRDSLVVHEEENVTVTAAGDSATAANEVDKEASSFWDDADSQNLKEMLANIVTRLDTSSNIESVTMETAVVDADDVSKNGVNKSEIYKNESESCCIEMEIPTSQSEYSSESSDSIKIQLEGTQNQKKNLKSETTPDKNLKDSSSTQFSSKNPPESPNNSHPFSPPKKASTPHALTVPKNMSTLKSPTTKKGNITPSNQHTPLKNMVTPLKKEVTPVKKEVTPVKKEVTPVKKEVTPVKKDVTPVKKEVTPVKKDVTPVKKEVTPVKKEVTPVKKEVTHVKVNATPVKVNATPVKVNATPVKVNVTPLKNASSFTAKSHISSPSSTSHNSEMETSNEDQNEAFPSKRSLRTNKAVDYFKKKIVEPADEMKQPEVKRVKRSTRQSHEDQSDSDISKSSFTSLNTGNKSHTEDASKTGSDDTLSSQDISLISGGGAAVAELSSSQFQSSRLSKRGRKKMPVDTAKNTSTESSKSTQPAGKKKLYSDDRDGLLLGEDPDTASQGMTLRRSTRIQDKSKN